MKMDGDKQEKKDKNVFGAELTDEIRKAYIDYAMSVIVSRALPSVEDGLKPVHRRILYAIHMMGLTHNKPTKKCARIVGEVLGKFHPHGDIAVYDALVRMAQDFSLRYPLIHGQGNFGSIDGDPPAAMRYSEARLSKIASTLLEEIDKQTVKFIPNFDNSLKEPVYLPARLPNLLINGSSGIAVGMTTNIPSHNLGEVIDGIIAYINNNNITIEQLMKYIPAPDFPTGGSIFNHNIKQMYETGRGQLLVKGKIKVEEGKSDKIIITEIPYMVNKSDLIKNIARLVEQKRLQDIKMIRDESAKNKIRIVLQLKKKANTKFIINKLYHLTSLETTFNAIIIALVNGQPKLLSLKDMIKVYVDHRVNITKRRFQFELNKARERLHIVEGLAVCLKNIDSVISIIKQSTKVEEASQKLMSKYKLTKQQCQAVLDMKLQRLTRLEQDKLKLEQKTLKDSIENITNILSSEREILKIIKKELASLKKEFGDARRTKLLGAKKEVREIELIKKEDVAILLTFKGYIKRIPLTEYQEQKRGGRGFIATELSEEDFVKTTFTCSTHDTIMFITDRGRLYSLKAYNIPQAQRYSKGKAIINILNIKDKIVSVVPVKPYMKKTDLIIATRKGVVKRVSIEDITKIKKSGINIIKIPINDSVVDAKVSESNNEVILATRNGIAIRFSINDIRKMGRAAYGVRGIRLRNDDVIGMEIIHKLDKELGIMTVTEKGYGKRTSIQAYRKIKRGGRGITNIICSDRNGKAVDIKIIKNDDSIIVVTQKGMMIRFKASDIRVMGRATQGVKIIKLKPNDKVSSLAKVEISE